MAHNRTLLTYLMLSCISTQDPQLTMPADLCQMPSMDTTAAPREQTKMKQAEAGMR